MRHKLIVLLWVMFTFACKEQQVKMNSKIDPPKADKIPTNLEKHGDVRTDNYFWLNQRDNPEVIDYLERENDYNDKMTASTKALQKSLFEEMKSRIKEQDESVPYKYNGYWYTVKYEEGKDYPVYTRRKETLDAPEELLFDCNKMAEDYTFFNLQDFSVSPDNKLAAFSIDTLSRRIYTIQVKNLETGELLPLKIENTTGGSVWANNSQTLFYTKKDKQTLRSDKVFKHTLGTDPNEDKLVFNETDDSFYTFIYKTKSDKYIVIGSTSTLTSEYRFLNADQPDGEFVVFQPRVRGLEYEIAHYKDNFYIVTNADGATNFKLMKTPEDKTGKEHWEEAIPHREDVLLESIDIFKDFLVLSERSNGLHKIRIKRWDDKEDYYLPFDNETYSVYPTTNLEFDTNTLRYNYTSLTTPISTIDFNMITQEKTVRKEQEVPGETFDKNNYTSERIWAEATDGTKIPISMVYRKGMERNGKNPLLLFGYGSYGAIINPRFSTVRLSLLDRGFIFAIAHIRGSQYMGRSWYENGKLLTKKNTFTDFIDCTKFLIDQQYSTPEHMYALGGSAGGLLMGAVLNMAPELYNGVIASVPFVDVITTMLDESIPLTTEEYDEWGNPNEKDYYDYIKSYSPYDNVSAQDYPNMLVNTG
ncbi:MAG: S9 family peptidase, partial [Bacteroidota bacterium]